MMPGAPVTPFPVGVAPQPDFKVRVQLAPAVDAIMRAQRLVTNPYKMQFSGNAGIIQRQESPYFNL